MYFCVGNATFSAAIAPVFSVTGSSLNMLILCKFLITLIKVSFLKTKIYFLKKYNNLLAPKLIIFTFLIKGSVLKLCTFKCNEVDHTISSSVHDKYISVSFQSLFFVPLTKAMLESLLIFLKWCHFCGQSPQNLSYEEGTLWKPLYLLTVWRVFVVGYPM